MDTKTGGPAFPHEYKYGDGTAHREDGMSLRDYFAAKALTGIIACAEDEMCSSSDESVVKREQEEYAKNIAQAAYRYADAMLTAREARHD